MSGLSELLARVEAATGPDRELDAELCAHFRLLSPAAEKERWAREWAGPVIARDGRVWRSHADGRTGLNCDARALTASIDHALALVERMLPAWAWSVGNKAKGGQAYLMRRLGAQLIGGTAPTPALAIIAALLTALIASEATAGMKNTTEEGD